MSVVAPDDGVARDAYRVIQLQESLRDCISALEYAVNHEHDQFWHKVAHESKKCELCFLLSEVIRKAKKTLGG